ncbi:MAG TPA: hypothetical protein VMI11_10105 [Actinomycetes bacterium]|nr:hypothetical protein [Actinomycetes bacterium]
MPRTVNASRRRPRRAGYALLALAVAAVGALALAPAQASSSAADAVVAKSSVTRLVPGRGLSSGPRVTLVKLKISPGTYYVQMPVTLQHTNPDPVDYVDVSLVCKDNYGHANQIGQAVNTLHGTTFTLQPRLYVTFTGSIRGVCAGYAYMGRIQGSPGASPSSRTIRVTSARLIVTKASTAARETIRFKGNTAANNHPYTGHSSRVSVGVHFHAAPVDFTVDTTKASSFSLAGDVFMTACTSPGGSQDPTTHGVNLCASVFKVIKAGPQVRTRLMVRQYAPDGVTACRTLVVPLTTTTFHISSKRHHLPVELNGTLTLPPMAGCGSHAQAWTEVYVESAPSVVVHFPSSNTAVVPI